MPANCNRCQKVRAILKRPKTVRNNKIHINFNINYNSN